MKTISKIEKTVCLTICLLAAVFCCKLALSDDLSTPSATALAEERETLLDDLQRLNFKIDALNEQLMELQDSLLKKNERISVIESQIGVH